MESLLEVVVLPAFRPLCTPLEMIVGFAYVPSSLG